MDIEVTEFARLEFDDAIQYYELEKKGLGLQFKSEIKKALDRIQKYPFAWPIEKGTVRKYILHKFPYKILYSTKEDKIIILAVGHQHRKPGYWADNF